MKKILIVLLFSLCALVTLTACGSDESSKFQLTVYARSWSSNDRMQAPEEEFYYDIKLNEKYVVKKDSFELSFTVTEINENSIVIKTTEPFSDNETGINLLTDKKEFTIERGGTIKLTTPTMDAGGIFTLKLY